jgi:hypothetical protein
MKFEVEVSESTIRDLKKALIFEDETLETASEVDVIIELFYLDTCDARGTVKVRLL